MMNVRYRFTILLSLTCFTLCTACLLPKFDLETVKQLIKDRPQELDALNMLVGEWVTSGEVKMIGMDETIQTHGTGSAAWECDGRILVDRSEYDMGPMGLMSGVSIWTWDSAKKKYRMWWYDSFGEIAYGTARYDKSTQTWHFKNRGHSSLCNVTSIGTIRMIDENTLEWTYDQWDSWGILKFSTMKGTSRRK